MEFNRVLNSAYHYNILSHITRSKTNYLKTLIKTVYFSLRYNWCTINYIYLKGYFDKFTYQDNEFIYYLQSFLTPIGIPPPSPSPGEGNGNPLQYSCLENPMDGGRNLVGYSPSGHEESETTERLHFLFSLSCVGEGNGNPLQCSCLENPRDGGAWWAAVYGVAQNQTRLKRLSSSSYPSPAPPPR